MCICFILDFIGRVTVANILSIVLLSILYAKSMIAMCLVRYSPLQITWCVTGSCSILSDNICWYWCVLCWFHLDLASLQELSEHLGIKLLNERLNDPSMQDSFESIFPKDNPKNTRFCINFFTSIGLGGLTENLREYLKNMPRLIMQQQKPVSDSQSGSSDSSDSESSGSESQSDSSSYDESESDGKRRKRRK